MSKPSSNVSNNKSTTTPTRYHNNYHSDQSAELLVLAVNKSDQVAILEEDISKDFITDPNNSLGVIQHQTINTVKIIKNLLTIDSSIIYNSIAQYIIDNETFNFTDIDTITAIVNATVNAIDITINETLKTNMINYIVQSNTLLEEWTDMTDSTLDTITSLLKTSSLIIEKSKTLDFTSSLDIAAEVLNIKETFSSVVTYSIRLPERDTSPMTGNLLAGAVSMYVSSYALKQVAIALYGEIGEWNTSNITDMSQLFADKRTFNEDIGNWDVSNVTNMNSMFYSASTFNQYIGNWNTSKVEYMGAMFLRASAFNQDINTKVVNLGETNEYIAWDVSNVINDGLTSFFLDAIAFNSDIGNWNISKVTAIYDMFWGASKFNQNINTKEVTLENGITYTAWDVSNKIAYGVFGDAIAFNQPLDKWNNLIIMRNMFDGATSFNQEIRMWDISNVENGPGSSGFDNMFRGAVAFDAVYKDESGYDNPTPTNFFWALYPENPQYTTDYTLDDSSIRGALSLWIGTEQQKQLAKDLYGEIGDWNTSSVTNMSQLFADKHTFNEDIGNWDVSNVTNMNSMFYSASTFNQYIGNWNTSKVEYMGAMFLRASAFNQDINTKVVNLGETNEYIAWDVSNVINDGLTSFFLDAIAFNSDIGNWNISKVTAIYDMFWGASKFNQNINTKEVTLENGITYTAWDVSNKIAYGVFGDAIAFNQPLDKWNNLILMRNMFDGATSFNQEIRMWDISKVESGPGPSGFDNMFRGAVAFDAAYKDESGYDNPTPTNFFWALYPENPQYTTDYTLDDSSIRGALSLWIGTEQQKQLAKDLYGEIGDWNTSSVTNMSQLFADKRTFNEDIGNWDVSNVTTMYSMFYRASTFNQYIGNWNTSKVEYMGAMFLRASAFNQDINTKVVNLGETNEYIAWDVSNVINHGLTSFFLDAIAFNSDIGNWNISKVTAIFDMFWGASKFNQNINTKEVTLDNGTTYTAWDVSNKIAYGVFGDAIAFNQPLDKWNNLIIMRNMFDGATSFNQEIRMWDISKVENTGFDNMVRGADRV